MRSVSGVTPMAVMTKAFYCPGQCTFCPIDLNLPKSYLRDEPAAQRALKVNFNPYEQVRNRLRQLALTGHVTDKVELIVIGGTFSVYSKEYRRSFFKGLFDACNGIQSKTLKAAQKKNESAKHRIVGISIETRPDWIDEKEVRLLRELGVTKLQVGVQAFDPVILKKVKRGHSLKPVANATLMLRNAGFKICYHFMPNLPGSNPEKDVEMAKVMYQDSRFKPDFVKIYPTQVIPRTELYEQWKRGEFRTYDDEIMKEVLKKIKLITPPWVRIDRLVRDISKQWVAGGTLQTNMRQVIQQELAMEGKQCQCIRCREVKRKLSNETPRMKRITIDTLGGTEVFLEYSTGKHLYSLLRMRLPNEKQTMLFTELNGAAIIREIHTYGGVVPVNEKQDDRAQHTGFGKSLLERAERIATKNGFKKVAVISAIGTRNYYRKLGYLLEGMYMLKHLASD